MVVVREQYNEGMNIQKYTIKWQQEGSKRSGRGRMGEEKIVTDEVDSKLLYIYQHLQILKNANCQQSLTLLNKK